MKPRENQQITLVTGANSGMGKATSLAFAKLGTHVVMMCRNKEKGEAARQEVVSESGNHSVDLHICDLGNLEDIRQFAQTFNLNYPKLDVLINNAAIITTKRKETGDGFELQFGVNHLGPFLLTNLLLEKLKTASSARIINVSSGAHKIGTIDFNDLQTQHKKYRTFSVYGQSKLANILFTNELARRLEDTNITANSLHPGAVATNLGIDRETGFGKTIVRMLRPFFKTPEEGADTAIYLATSPEVAGVSGKYFINRKVVKTKKAEDPTVAKKLWEVSEKLVGLR
ncbi:MULTISPECIES: SDR family oxidoreductase [Bacillaceae]|uniref:SDR family oxidoreductase n=1 Tax=Evansella alkalicola TaxID=745819 RepID=A0ABS6JNG3_9BACI|nr:MULTISPECIES: SDR family oxidoreductase [Bacillaceae]MBU9719965.1 SDR family oxidoreductase [Bacillus alkalicola]